MSNLIRGDRRHIVLGATLVSGSTVTRVLGPYDLLAYPHKSFTLYNQGSVTLSGALIRINFDQQGNEPNTPGSNQSTNTLSGPNDGLWETYDSTTFTSLASGGIKTAHISTATARWWDLVAINNQTPAITVSGALNACAV